MGMLSKISAWKWATYLSVVGIVLALYLLYNYYAPTPSKICDLGSTLNCGAVSRGGTLATFLGIPVALVGLTGYIVMLISSLAKKSKLLLGTVTFGMLFCLRMTILEVFVVKILCPICIACQIVMLLVFLISLSLHFGKTPKEV